MATDEDRGAIDAKIRELENRLNRLEIKKARYGYTADPSLDSEIEDLQFTLETMRRQLEGPQLLPEARASLDRYAADNMAFVLASLRALMERQTKTEEELKRQGQQQHTIREKQTEASDDIGKLFDHYRTEKREGTKGRQRNWRIQVFNAVVLLVLAGAVIWLLIEVNAR